MPERLSLSLQRATAKKPTKLTVMSGWRQLFFLPDPGFNLVPGYESTES